MDRIGGWEEEHYLGSRFAASMWIKTKAVVCRGAIPHAKLQVLHILIYYDTINWVCDDALDEHVWVSELTISLQEAKVLEALQYDLEIPRIVQWEMLWFTASTSLNNDLLHDGVILEKYNEAVNLFFFRVFSLCLAGG